MPLQTFDVTGSRPTLPRLDGRKGMADSVDIQLSVTVNVPRGKTLAREVIIEAIRFRAFQGRDPKGFKIKIIRWRNPDRSGQDDPETEYKNAEDAELQPGWRKYGPQKERWATLARSLQGPRMEFTVTESSGKRRRRTRVVFKIAKRGKARRKIKPKKAANR